MKVVKPYGRHGEQYLDLEDPAFQYQTSEALVKTKFRRLGYWFEEAERLQKENTQLKAELKQLQSKIK